ncbi:MAG TPA: hypothetical protein VMX55_06070 [candidate division Zixibacteria bacterium]|nr:hypothetical protein [candidate division Zixibacteria bacterium]
MHDIILNKMKLLQSINDESTTKLLTDKNLQIMLQILYKPCTIEEIAKAYHEIDKTKSHKTIYRYLAILKKSGLVIEAGKRILEGKNQQILNQTLFTRSASIFSIGYSNSELNPESEKDLNFIKDLLMKKFDIKNTLTTEELSKFFFIINRKKCEIIENLLAGNRKELNEISGIVDWTRILNLLDTLSWLILFKDEDQTLKEFIQNIKVK